MNIANPEKNYYTYYSLQQWGKHGKSGFLGGGSSNMTTLKNILLIRKNLANPEKNVLHTIAHNNGVSMRNQGF